MSAPILVLTVPKALASLLTTALRAHPDVASRPGADIAGLRAELDRHTRSRVHSDRMPWDHGSDWVDQLVDAEIRSFGGRLGSRRTLWPATSPAVARRIATATGGRVVTWIADGRHGLGSAASADPVAAAVAAGRAWAERATEAESLDDAIDAGQAPAALLSALGLAPHDATTQALSLLRAVPPPRVGPALTAAFAAWPPAAERLARLGVATGPAPNHPSVHAARALHAAHVGEHAAAEHHATAALALAPPSGVRGEAIDALVIAGALDAAAAHLERWRVEADAPAAWTRLLALSDHPASFAVASRARRHRDPLVRGALARWLVHHGLDREGAETVCRVRDEDWWVAPPAPPWA